MIFRMRRGSIICTILIVIAALSVGAAFRLYTLMNTGVDEIKKTIRYDRQHGTLNLLVLGLDEVEDVNRSDTIILARVDIDRKTASVMSIPRDTRVTIKGHKQQKLNHAYAFGGLDLLRETVVNLTGVPVNYYLILNYDSFPKIVDAVGGVEIDVAKRMKYSDKAQKLNIDFQPGRQHMNGAQGLRYVRFRMDALGDVGRMQRQQQFAKVFLDKVLSPAILPRLPELIELVLSEIKTDVPIKTAIQLAGQLKDMKKSNIRFFTMPGSAAYIDNISYWIPDLQSASTLLNPNSLPDQKNDGLSGDAPPDKKPAEQPKEERKEQKNDPSVNAPQSDDVSPADLQALIASFKEPICVLNGTGRAGLGKQFATIFEKAGIEVAYTGNAKHSDFRYCIVQYPEGKSSETAMKLAKMCGISPNLVRKARIDYAAALVLGKNNDKQVMSKLQELFANR